MFGGNIKELGKTNDNFRRVLFTTERSQIVAMKLAAGEDIGEEVHEQNDQLFVIVDGTGEALVGSDTRSIQEDDLVCVPAGTNHNITNTGEGDLKLITIYTPPAHPDGTTHRTKQEAEEAEE